jgi:hypothetical protein
VTANAVEPRLATMGLRNLRPGWPLILLGIAFQGLAAGALGITGAALLDYFGLAGARDKGNEIALLWAAGALLASGLLALSGAALLRTGKQRG